MKTLLYTAKSSVFCTFYIWMEWLYINKIKYKIHLYWNYNIEYINNFTKKKKKNTSIFIIFSLFLVFVDLFPYFSSLLDSYSQNLSLREKALQSLYNYSFYLFLVTNFFFWLNLLVTDLLIKIHPLMVKESWTTYIRSSRLARLPWNLWHWMDI